MSHLSEVIKKAVRNIRLGAQRRYYGEDTNLKAVSR